MTYLRAFRITIGLNTYEIAELLGCSQPSISMAEREVACKNIAVRETEFLDKVYNVLSEAEKKEVSAIAASLCQWDSKKGVYRTAVASV